MDFKETGVYAGSEEFAPKIERARDFLSQDFLGILTNGGIISTGGTRYYPYSECDIDNIPEGLRQEMEDKTVVTATLTEVFPSVGDEEMRKSPNEIYYLINPHAIERLIYNKNPRSKNIGIKTSRGTAQYSIQRRGKIDYFFSLSNLFANRTKQILDLQGIPETSYSKRHVANDVLSDLADRFGAGEDLELKEKKLALHNKVSMLREKYSKKIFQ